MKRNNSILDLRSFMRPSDADDCPLSEFQQQSLSVFESEHMWAHFKAHLADSNIQTAAGVIAMLPQFVNDRVLDGSVRSDGPGLSSDPRYSSVQGSSNRTLDLDVSERSNSIDAYQHAIRGEVENVLAYHETVKTEVQQQRCRLSIDATSRRSSVFSSLGWSDAPSNADVQQQRNLLSIDSTSRRSSVFSSLGWSDPNNSNKHSLDAPPFRSIRVSRHLTRRRSSGLSLCSSKDDLATKITSDSSGSSVRPRPVNFEAQEITGRNSTNMITNTDYKSVSQGQDSGLTVTEVDTFRPKPFSYRPKYSCKAMMKDADERVEKSAQSISSRDTFDTLLVEWGEIVASDDYSSSSEYPHQVNDSDRAVVINRKELVGTDLVVDWGLNREDDDESWLDDALNRGVSAANSQHTNSR